MQYLYTFHNYIKNQYTFSKKCIIITIVNAAGEISCKAKVLKPESLSLSALLHLRFQRTITELVVEIFCLLGHSSG